MTKKQMTKQINSEAEIKETIKKITQEEIAKLHRSGESDETYEQWLEIKETKDQKQISKFFRSMSEQWLGFTDEYKIKDIWEVIEPIYSKKDIFQTSERQNLYKIQERLFDKLDYETTADFERLGKSLTIKAERQTRSVIKYQLPPIGTILTKTWNNKKLEVKIVEAGFEYEGKTYKSLSKLASTITGYPCSGPFFFGIKKLDNK